MSTAAELVEEVTDEGTSEHMEVSYQDEEVVEEEVVLDSNPEEVTIQEDCSVTQQEMCILDENACANNQDSSTTYEQVDTIKIEDNEEEGGVEDRPSNQEYTIKEEADDVHIKEEDGTGQENATEECVTISQEYVPLDQGDTTIQQENEIVYQECETIKEEDSTSQQEDSNQQEYVMVQEGVEDQQEYVMIEQYDSAVQQEDSTQPEYVMVQQQDSTQEEYVMVQEEDVATQEDLTNQHLDTTTQEESCSVEQEVGTDQQAEMATSEEYFTTNEGDCAVQEEDCVTSEEVYIIQQEDGSAQQEDGTVTYQEDVTTYQECYTTETVEAQEVQVEGDTNTQGSEADPKEVLFTDLQNEISLKTARGEFESLVDIVENSNFVVSDR